MHTHKYAPARAHTRIYNCFFYLIRGIVTEERGGREEEFRERVGRTFERDESREGEPKLVGKEMSLGKRRVECFGSVGPTGQI